MKKLEILEYVLQNHYDCLSWRGWEGVFALDNIGGIPVAMFKAATLSDLVEQVEEWLKAINKE